MASDNSCSDRELTEEEAAYVDERTRTVTSEWSDYVVTTRLRIRGCFGILRDITLLVEIVPSLICILLGLCLFAATVHNISLPVSSQLHYEERFVIFRNKTTLKKICVPESNFNITKSKEFCFKTAPVAVSNIATKTWFRLSGAMILVGTARIIIIILFFIKLPLPKSEMVISGYFLLWCFVGIACIFVDSWGWFILSPMGNPTKRSPDYRDYVFTNDPYHLFYYLCTFMYYYFVCNLGTLLLSKAIMIPAHILCRYQEVKIYA